MLRSLLGNNEWNWAVADANYVRWRWERSYWLSLQQVSSSLFHAISIWDWKKMCLWDFGDKSRCGVFRTNVYRGGTYVSGGQSSQKPNLEVWKVRTLLCNICSAGPRKLLTIWSIVPNASQSFSIYKSTGWLCQGRKTSPCWQPNSTRNSNNLISTGRSIQQ